MTFSLDSRTFRISMKKKRYLSGFNMVLRRDVDRMTLDCSSEWVAVAETKVACSYRMTLMNIIWHEASYLNLKCG